MNSKAICQAGTLPPSTDWRVAIDQSRRQLLSAVRGGIAAGMTRAEIGEEADATATAMRSLAALECSAHA